MKKGYILLAIGAFFVFTRKKYRLKDLDIFIPNTSLLGRQSDETTLQAIKKNININFSGGNWIISIKPIYGFTIPYTAILPITAPIAIPQLILQIGNNIKLEDVKKLGILLGKRLIIKGVTFYA